MAPHWRVGGALVSASSIRIDQVSKVFAGKTALESVSLDLAPGSFTVLLGPSGSGKTTLLRCLAGIERPSAGTIAINDVVVASDRGVDGPEKRNLSMVFQDYALWPHLTVQQNVAYPLAGASLSKSARQSRVAMLLEQVGIAHLGERYPNELSGGEQQRVALARALSAEVGLVLFDEPLSNLDADRREQLRIAIATLTRESGATAVYITHDQAEAFALADNLGVLRHGRLVQFGSPETIYQRPADAFVARFTGVAVELPVASWSVSNVESARVVVALAGAPVLSAIMGVGLTPNCRATLLVRPAAVSIEHELSENGIRGTVRDTAFTGRGYEHVVALHDTVELSKVFATERYDRGSIVSLRFDVHAMFLMPTTEGSLP